ncbi:MAG: hypothetical protein LBS78_00495 [Endomicrobium sp.]|jgi:hypothetical protein|nr:hypothetical protein [Endomicrobium sp.]
MRIVKVDTKKQFKEFIRFPYKIYSKSGPWVPHLLSDITEMFSKDRNPFWLHAKKQLFLAYDSKDCVIGRIAAIVDHNYIAFHGFKCGFFGFFECFDNTETANLLFLSVENWLKEQNIYKMIGPVNPSTNYECGFLSHGFEMAPSLMMPYNPRYYLYLAEQYGLIKVKELYAYNMDIVADERASKLEKIVTMVRKKLPMLEVKSMKKSSFEKDLESVIYIYNSAWEKNWGFVPLNKEEFKAIVKKMKMLIDPKLVIIASFRGLPIGMLISLPDYNQVLQKLNGKLFPFGIIKFLYYRKKIDNLRLMIMGVVKEYRHKGIEAVMCEEGLKNALKVGYKHCELSWVLDDNIMTQRTAEMMKGKLYKKYMIYSN